MRITVESPYRYIVANFISRSRRVRDVQRYLGKQTDRLAGRRSSKQRMERNEYYTEKEWEGKRERERNTKRDGDRLVL